MICASSYQCQGNVQIHCDLIDPEKDPMHEGHCKRSEREKCRGWKHACGGSYSKIAPFDPFEQSMDETSEIIAIERCIFVREMRFQGWKTFQSNTRLFR